MTGGSFNQQGRALTDFHFERARFSGVTFTGNFAGCSFGDWDSVETSTINPEPVDFWSVLDAWMGIFLEEAEQQA